MAYQGSRPVNFILFFSFRMAEGKTCKLGGAGKSKDSYHKCGRIPYNEAEVCAAQQITSSINEGFPGGG